jgi:hypothetical protein
MYRRTLQTICVSALIGVCLNLVAARSLTAQVESARGRNPADTAGPNPSGIGRYQALSDGQRILLMDTTDGTVWESTKANNRWSFAIPALSARGRNPADTAGPNPSGVGRCASPGGH